jgi:hypothetical protein
MDRVSRQREFSVALTDALPQLLFVLAMAGLTACCGARVKGPESGVLRQKLELLDPVNLDLGTSVAGFNTALKEDGRPAGSIVEHATALDWLSGCVKADYFSRAGQLETSAKPFMITLHEPEGHDLQKLFASKIRLRGIHTGCQTNEERKHLPELAGGGVDWNNGEGERYLRVTFDSEEMFSTVPSLRGKRDTVSYDDWGLVLGDLPGEQKTKLFTLEKTGVRVTSVKKDSFADSVGLIPEDVIVTLNGTSIMSVSDFHRMAMQVPPGAKVRLKVQRDRHIEFAETGSPIAVCIQYLSAQNVKLAPVLR